MSTHDETQSKLHKHPNYLVVYIALAVLTATITAIELMSQNGIITWPRATLNGLYLAMSVTKAVLVALFYMHLKFDSFLYSILFGVPVMFAIIFFAFLLI